MSEWQPIETAPHDTMVLVFDGEAIGIACRKTTRTEICKENRTFLGGKETSTIVIEGTQWKCGMLEDGALHWWPHHNVRPTHWMPLPEPPKQEAS